MTCSIPIRVDHLPVNTRRDAAEWCVAKYADKVDVLRPLTVKVTEGGNLCNEIYAAPCFWFEDQKDANWFSLRWL